VKRYPDVLWVRRFAVRVWPGAGNAVVRQLRAHYWITDAFVAGEFVVFDVVALHRKHAAAYASAAAGNWALGPAQHLTSSRFRWGMEVHRA
jgi:hypothetical protein